MCPCAKGSKVYFTKNWTFSPQIVLAKGLVEGLYPDSTTRLFLFLFSFTAHYIHDTINMSFIQNRPSPPSPTSSPPSCCGDTPHCVDIPETNEWADTSSSVSTSRSEGDTQTAFLFEQSVVEGPSPVAPEPSWPEQGANEETTPMISASSQTVEMQDFVAPKPPQQQSRDANVAPQRPADLAEARRIIYADLMARTGLLLGLTIFLPLSTLACILWARVRQHSINIDLFVFDFLLGLTPLVLRASRMFERRHTWILFAMVLFPVLVMNGLNSIHYSKPYRGIYIGTRMYLFRW